MTEKMKAARFYEVGEPLRIDRIPVPQLGPGDVLVEINNLGRKNDKKCPPLFSKSGNWCILEAKKVRCDADCFALDCECVLTRGYKLKVAICRLKLHVQWVRICERMPIFGNLFKAVRKPAKMKKGSR